MLYCCCSNCYWQKYDGFHARLPIISVLLRNGRISNDLLKVIGPYVLSVRLSFFAVAKSHSRWWLLSNALFFKIEHKLAGHQVDLGASLCLSTCAISRSITQYAMRSPSNQRTGVTMNNCNNAITVHFRQRPELRQDPRHGPTPASHMLQPTVWKLLRTSS